MALKTYSSWLPEFDPVSGGIRVLYGLYGWLLSKGQIVVPNSSLDDIAIYPEIVRGNPLGAKKSIRYILQKPNVMSYYGIPGPTTYEYNNDPIYKDDEIYVFSKVYDQWNLPDDHILFLPIIDLHTFKDYGKKRKKTAYYCARGHNQHKHPEDSVEITRQFATDQQALADLLNECETLYVYDKITAMLEVARLCGTKIAYYGDTPLETLEKYEPGLEGIGYKTNDIKKPTLFRDTYIDLQRKFNLKLDKFIEQTQ